jgi:RND superfamily putative drug exporter
VFDALARLVSRWPRFVLLVAAATVAAGVVAGAGLPALLQTGGYTDPAAESSAARTVLDERFAAVRPDMLFLVSAPGGVDSRAAAAQGRRLTAALTAEPGLVGVTSYWRGGSPELRSADGTAALVVARISTGSRQVDSHDTNARADALRRAYGGRHGPVEVAVGGAAMVNADVEEMSQEDLRRAELLSIPIVAVILLFVFGGLVAAALPLIIGVVGIVGTAASLRVVAEFTEVSVFAPNLAVGLGLGLAVDYALFMVRRHREELRAVGDVHTAVRRTLATAGRTVAFSAFTVVLSMSAMLLFPMYFLRSFSYAGISVVLLAAVAALVPLPAALVLVGHRIDALDVRALLRRGRTSPVRGTGSPAWRRIAETVTGRPVVFTLLCTALLVTLSSQVLHVEMGNPDDRTLPASAQSHQVQRQLREAFADQPASLVAVVAEGAGRQALGAYARRVSTVDGVGRVVTATGVYVHGAQVTGAGPQLAPFVAGDGAYLAVAADAEAISAAGKRLVREVRAVGAPFRVLVGGSSAELLDTQDSMARLVPWGLGLIAGTTLVLLFLLTGSLLLPVKALVMNVLSLGATFGVLIWIFQDGHLAGLLGFQVTGWVMVQLLVLLFAVAFGVSMDYEVFLLSRINEEYARVPDNHRAVVAGVERTGGVVTAAALITAVVFVAMASSRLTHITMFGIGLALAVLMDAFVVRALLVPALMTLAGRANWWAPAPLRRVYTHAGLGLARRVDHDASRRHAGVSS